MCVPPDDRNQYTKTVNILLPVAATVPGSSCRFFSVRLEKGRGGFRECRTFRPPGHIPPGHVRPDISTFRTIPPPFLHDVGHFPLPPPPFANLQSSLPNLNHNTNPQAGNYLKTVFLTLIPSSEVLTLALTLTDPRRGS